MVLTHLEVASWKLHVCKAKSTSSEYPQKHKPFSGSIFFGNFTKRGIHMQPYDMFMQD